MTSQNMPYGLPVVNFGGAMIYRKMPGLGSRLDVAGNQTQLNLSEPFSFRLPKCVLESPSQFGRIAVSHSSHPDQQEMLLRLAIGSEEPPSCHFPASQIAIPGASINRACRVYTFESVPAANRPMLVIGKRISSSRRRST
jgi:hypothetical protein